MGRRERSTGSGIISTTHPSIRNLKTSRCAQAALWLLQTHLAHKICRRFVQVSAQLRANLYAQCRAQGFSFSATRLGKRGSSAAPVLFPSSDPVRMTDVCLRSALCQAFPEARGRYPASLRLGIKGGGLQSYYAELCESLGVSDVSTSKLVLPTLHKFWDGRIPILEPANDITRFMLSGK